MGISLIESATPSTVKSTRSPSRKQQSGSSNGETREEGEIVDDFEDIISSDEELSMRKRIEELEAKNSELEKLANISGYYNDYDLGTASDRYKPNHSIVDKITKLDYSRAPPTAKFFTKPRKQLTLSSLPHEHERYSPYHPGIYSTNRKYDYQHATETVDYSSLTKHQASRKRKHDKIKRTRNSRKKTRSKNRKKARLDYSVSSDDEEFCALDRNKLRMALKHDVPIKVKTDENLENAIIDRCKDREDDAKKSDEVIVLDENSDKPAESDDSESLEIQELRLIALKSAFLRKDRQRKQRKEMDQKKPYSPTDCLQPIRSVDAEIASPQNLLDNTVCHSMDISPISSPNSLNDGCIRKPVDMDIVDSSDNSSPEFLESQPYWAPIHPVNEIPLPNSSHHETDYHVSSNASKPIISSIPTYMPTHKPSSIRSTKSKSSECDENEKVLIASDDNSSPEQSDEEVMALRALLLAQKNSPKFTKNTKHSTNNKSGPPAEIEGKTVDCTGPVDPLHAILKISQGPANKTQEILKEAVKRLQNKSNQSQKSVNQDSDSMTSNFSLPMEVTTPPNSQFPNEVDYRLPITCISSPVDTPTKYSGAFHVVTTASPSSTTSINVLPGKSVKIKENIFTSAGNRPNNIEIIPTVFVPRPIRKLPLTDITEIDNVSVEGMDVGTKTKQSESSAKVETTLTLNPAQQTKSSQPKEKDDRIIESASNEGESAKTELDKRQISTAQKDKTPFLNVQKISPKSKVLANLSLTPAQSTTLVKRQRKRSTTSLELLQMKTQNLISSGKFISRNKVVATKLLNKAIHHTPTSTTLKRKVTVEKPESSDNIRLITNVSVPTVKPLVITINCKSSESDSDVDGYSEADRRNKLQRDHNDFNDVGSPMSLPMESPRDSPLTITQTMPSVPETVNANNNNNNVNSNDKENIRAVTVNCIQKTNRKVSEENNLKDTKEKNGTFEAKLEEFLKNARSKVDMTKKDVVDSENSKTTIEGKRPKTTTKVAAAATATTPAAVRHLPISAQLEYRRLVNRMQMLEKQKVAKNETIVTSIENTFKVTINNNLATSQSLSPKTNNRSVSNVNVSSKIDKKIASVSAAPATNNTNVPISTSVPNKKTVNANVPPSDKVLPLQSTISAKIHKSTVTGSSTQENVNEDASISSEPKIVSQMTVIPLEPTKTIDENSVNVAHEIISSTKVDKQLVQQTTNGNITRVAAPNKTITNVTQKSKQSVAQRNGNSTISSTNIESASVIVQNPPDQIDKDATVASSSTGPSHIVATNSKKATAKPSMQNSQQNNCFKIKIKTVTEINESYKNSNENYVSIFQPQPVVAENANQLPENPSNIEKGPVTTVQKVKKAISSQKIKKTGGVTTKAKSSVVPSAQRHLNQASKPSLQKTKSNIPTSLSTKSKAIAKTTTPTKKSKVTATAKNILKSNQNPKKNSTTINLPKLNELRTTIDCDHQYQQASSNLLENMKKAIQLVVAAQKEKSEKLMLEKELEQLRKKVTETEKQLKEKDTIMTTIFPKISASHKLIVALKDRTTNLEKLSIDLSKRLGDRRNNKIYAEQKANVKRRSKELTVEIKKLMELKNPEENQREANNIAINKAIQVDFENDICDNSNQLIVDIQPKPPGGLVDSTETSNINKDNVVKETTSKHDLNPLPSSFISSKSISSNLSNSSMIQEKTNNNDDDDDDDDCFIVECDKQIVQTSSIANNRDTTRKKKRNERQRRTGLRKSKRVPLKYIPHKEPELYFKLWDIDETKRCEMGTLPKSVGHKDQYISPLEDVAGSINPNGILCPYELMGQCVDKECEYQHLNT